MILTFDVTNHPLLSNAARSIADAAVLEAHNALAETVLGVAGAKYRTEAEVQSVSLALVLQINFQIARGVDAVFASSTSSGKSGQSTVYRELDVNPVARKIISDLQRASTGTTSGEGWSTVPSKWQPTGS